MFLTSLIYASSVSSDFNTEDIKSILQTAKTANTEKDITGILCFNNNYFLQCLEGGRKNINTLYQKILKDPRHNDIVLLHYDEITQRAFADWSMGYIPESTLTKPLIIKYTQKSSFNPYTMPAKNIYQLLADLKKNADGLT